MDVVATDGCLIVLSVVSVLRRVRIARYWKLEIGITDLYVETHFDFEGVFLAKGCKKDIVVEAPSRGGGPEPIVEISP